MSNEEIIEVSEETEIRVEYDGEYPNMCRGTLRIWEAGKLIYTESGYCSSSGSVWFDEKWEEHVEEGVLTWDEEKAEKFDKRIVDAVNDKLSEYLVCCGGCI